MSSPETSVDSFETGCSTRSGTWSQEVTERESAVGETEVVTMHNVSLPRMIYLNVRSSPPNPPLQTASTPPCLAENRRRSSSTTNIVAPLSNGHASRGDRSVCHPCATALTTVISAATESTGPGSYTALMGPVPTVMAGRGVRTGTYRYSARSAAGGDFTSQLDRLNR